jgi:hypothetical protein
MKRSTMILTAILAVAAVFALGVQNAAAVRGGEGGRGDGPIIYVVSQGLFYDSIVTADPLPAKGPFQELRMVGGSLETDFGPGDPGHRGGRWWIDRNGNREMDAGDKYFSCPLLGPGREEP